MSGIDLKGLLFYTPEEVATLFRRTLKENRVDREGNLVAKAGDPDVDWVYRTAARGFLKAAVRRFGRKQTLFLRAEVDRIACEGASTKRKDVKP